MTTTPHLAAGTFRSAQAAAISAQVTEQDNRAFFIEELYRLSGRTNGVYTGLWQQFRADLLEDFAQRLAEQYRDAWCRHQRKAGAD